MKQRFHAFRPRSGNVDYFVRRGNVRRALRAVAAKEGLPISRISFRSRNIKKPGSEAWGEFDPRSRSISIVTGLQNSRGLGEVYNTAAHELAHGRQKVGKHDLKHYQDTIRLEMKIREHVESLAKADRSYQPGRKSGGGGEVEVSAHERDGHPVSAYVRSRPGR